MARIGEVLDLIDDIARQTNLWALNATIVAVGRTNEMTREVLGAAEGLLRHSADLDDQIDQFLQKIRAV